MMDQYRHWQLHQQCVAVCVCSEEGKSVCVCVCTCVYVLSTRGFVEIYVAVKARSDLLRCCSRMVSVFNRDTERVEKLQD